MARITKRVGILVRVSTGKQDYTMQIREIEDFCKKKSSDKEEWVILEDKIYIEDGVSAFKNSIFERKETIQILDDCKRDEIDVFLTYFIDRIGRTGIETSYYIDLLIKTGVEVWSVNEGKIDTSDMVGQIMLSVNTSKARDESVKTSIRVNSDHKQMVYDCIFRGGNPPYGYKLVRTGDIGEPVYNKKKKELMAMVKDGEEEKVVKLIFSLAYEYGYGGNRIAKHLNGLNIPSKTGVRWSAGTIKVLLRNPIYIGYLTYGKSKGKLGTNKKTRQPKDEWILSEERNPNWSIIDEHTFNEVQKRREEVASKYSIGNDKPVVSTHGKLLFTGLIYCGHCGSALSQTTNNKKWTLKDGTEKSRKVYKYRCVGKSSLVKDCDGQTLYGDKKIETIVMDLVYTYIDSLKEINHEDEIGRRSKGKFKLLKKEYDKVIGTIKETEEELQILIKEIPKALMGKSSFSEDILQQLIEDKKGEIIELSKKSNLLKEELRTDKSETDNLEIIKGLIPVWKDEFEKSPFEKKKIMLSYIIEKIVVSREKIDIKFNIDVSKIHSVENEVLKGVDWEYNNTQKTPHKTSHETNYEELKTIYF